MKYSRFELLVLIVGISAVVGGIVLGMGGEAIAEEVIAQVLLLGVLFAAVHWGRNGGFWAAVAASLAYLGLRVPLLLGDGITTELVSLILVRVLSYGLIGVVGGELCSRIKYIFAKLENSSSVDDWSQLFNQRIIGRSLETASGQFARYETPFSIVLVELAPSLMGDLRVSKQRTLVRGVADHIRGDVRLVDEAGRLDDGRFLIVLPQTPSDGARVVAERIRRGVCNLLGSKDASITVTALSAPENTAEIGAVRATLGGDVRADSAIAGSADQASS